jgi:hypothetical protein
MAPQVSDDLKLFANHLVEHYAPTFESIQDQILRTYRFEFAYDDANQESGPTNIFELSHTKVHQGNTTKDIVFTVFGCIINGHFYWANQMNQHWKPAILKYEWKTNVNALFDNICVMETDPRTVPYLISLIHAPECSVVTCRSADDIELFAITDLVMAAEPSITFDASPLLNLSHNVGVL